MDKATLILDETGVTTLIGAVGSGKTSLLLTILGELTPTTGKVTVNGRISYAAQEPWIFNKTIKQNIILDADYDETRYLSILSACALDEDLKKMRLGDRTLAGENGGSLSGGQRARVNLARALYRDADIYLLDDPFASLDPPVAAHVYEGMCSVLSEKVAILVTHRHELGNQGKKMILVKEGRVDCSKSFEALQEIVASSDAKIGDSEIGDYRNGVVRKEDFVGERQRKRTGGEDAGVKGKVGWDVYKEYLKSFGNPWVVFGVASLFVLGQACASASDYYVGYW